MQISMAQGDVPRQLPALCELRKTKEFQNESGVSEKKRKSGNGHQGLMLNPAGKAGDIPQS